HLRVPSTEVRFTSTLGREMVKCSFNFSRMGLAMLVMSSKEVTPFTYIQFHICLARNASQPMEASALASSSLLRPIRLGRLGSCPSLKEIAFAAQADCVVMK